MNYTVELFQNILIIEHHSYCVKASVILSMYVPPVFHHQAMLMLLVHKSTLHDEPNHTAPQVSRTVNKKLNRNTYTVSLLYTQRIKDTFSTFSWAAV